MRVLLWEVRGGGKLCSTSKFLCTLLGYLVGSGIALEYGMDRKHLVGVCRRIDI